MCGIVAVLRAPGNDGVADVGRAAALVAGAAALLADAGAGPRVDALGAAADALEQADRLLKGVPGVRGLLEHPAQAAAVAGGSRAVAEAIDRLDAAFDRGLAGPFEALNAALVRVKDAAWAIRHDRLRTACAVEDLLAGSARTPSAVAAMWSVQVALSSLDRLEVRGRDSAGLHLLVHGHGLDTDAPGVRALMDGRAGDRLFTSRAVAVADGSLSFVYKAAAEIGELGDNTRALRDAIRADELAHLAVAAPGAQVVVLGHTRWASIGVISQPNAHPVNSDEQAGAGPYVVGVLNGDVDNHADLCAAEGLRIAPEITTDAKVIPTLVSRQLAGGAPLLEAFRRTVASFEGSVAIAAQASAEPGTVLLAQRGSGQALYVGLADGAFVVASEPYGLVEETPDYVRLDGETPADPANPAGSRGQVVALDAARAGSLAGIRRLSYDGSEVVVAPDDRQQAQVTTRDVDRGGFAHFLLKEITESPDSLRKTLRGRITERGGALVADLGPDAIPPGVARRLADGSIRRVVVIGQGTAHVAGRSMARALAELVDGTGVAVQAMPGTELSGSGMRADFSDTLVVAISQSGTTTDTNRTVDLARARGASVIGIVNRRNSDLTEKADGVVYTSDGRDVEMSVASTKAFYAQVAAGVLLACELAERLGASSAQARHRLLGALRELPDAMVEVLARRPQAAEAAHRLAPSRRYWAVVGSGPNAVAAQEVRIKASELCYKAIACDTVEDKKHIDLSSEPLILVCAAGATGSTADDLAKEVAIYRAHKAAPVVVVTEGDGRFGAALHVIEVPAVEPALAFVLSAMAGHLFAYEAALAIDAQARQFREARAAIEHAVAAGDSGDALLGRLATSLDAFNRRFHDMLRSGALNGHLEAVTAVHVAGLLRFALGHAPLDAYALEEGRVGTPSALVEDLVAALSRAVDELTRPVDAIKHQAKTVTVGISRSDENLVQARLVQEVLAAGVGRDRLSYRSLKVLAGIDPAVTAVTGWTRYRLEGEPSGASATIRVVDRGGISVQLPSRTDANPVLRGTKRRVAIEREVTVAKGRSDGRTVVLVPELKAGECTGLTLLHVRFADRLAPHVARSVLEGYGRGRYEALVDAVCETEPTFREDLLDDVGMVDLLTEPVVRLADLWRTAPGPA